MTFNVGDKVRITNCKFSGINYEPYAVVTRVADHGAMLLRGDCVQHSAIDENNWHLFFRSGSFEPIGKTLSELDVKPGDVVRGVDCTFANEKDFTCVNIVAGGKFDGEHTMKSDSYGQGIFGPENGLWHIVSRAAITKPTPPSKMHPDDFVNAVNDFARDNGFSVDTMAIKTQGGATVYYTNPQPAS